MRRERRSDGEGNVTVIVSAEVSAVVARARRITARWPMALTSRSTVYVSPLESDAETEPARADRKPSLRISVLPAATPVLGTFTLMLVRPQRQSANTRLRRRGRLRRPRRR